MCEGPENFRVSLSLLVWDLKKPLLDGQQGSMQRWFLSPLIETFFYFVLRTTSILPASTMIPHHLISFHAPPGDYHGFLQWLQAYPCRPGVSELQIYLLPRQQLTTGTLFSFFLGRDDTGPVLLGALEYLDVVVLGSDLSRLFYYGVMRCDAVSPLDCTWLLDIIV